ncbi:MAG: toxin-antitoxin system YwqK family antitoxin [Cytophagaceae bacterium]
MKLFFKYTTAFIFILCFTCGNAQPQNNVTDPNGYNIFYFDNGIKSSEGFMKNGKPDGYWKNYYMTGIIKNEGNRKNFQLDSTWKFYNEKGKLQKSYTYREGKKNGFLSIYDTLGRIISKENYVNDIKQGDAFLYYKSGKVKQIVPYKNGRADGISYEFTEDSTIISIVTYKMGFIEHAEKINRKDEKGNKQGLWKEFYADGKVKKESRFKDNTVDGYIKEYDVKGDLQNIEKYNNGKKVENPPELAKLDVFKTYYENGNVKYEGGYINGMPIGTHFHYKQSRETCDSVLIYEDTIAKRIFHCFSVSVPDSAIVYQNGYLVEKGPVDSLRRRQKEWTEYHLTGEFKAKGQYVDDKRIGEWTFYYPNKKIEQKGRYDKKGRAQGEWKWYYESGALLRDENYLNGKREGLLQEFTEEGKLITKGEFSDDEREGPWYYEIVNYKEFGNYRLGLPDSMWKAYYIKENKLRFEGNFVNGDPDGRHTWFYANGRQQASGKFVAGMKQGEWKFFDEIGNLTLTIYYENDTEVKWDGIKIVPTFEESLRVYETVKKKNDKTDVDKTKKTGNLESVEDEEK